MERLTLTKEQRESEKVGYAKYFSENLCQKIDEKLAHYEDLEESGRLHVSPCKLGDTVYYPFAKKILEKTVTSFMTDKKGTYVFLENRLDEGLYAQDFGKTVFLTKEDAERALAEREKS